MVANLRNLHEADQNRLAIAGVSRGGILAIAYAGMRPGRFRGAINFNGGWLGRACPSHETVNPLLFGRGAKAGIPTVWLHGSHDQYYRIGHCRANLARFLASGGQGQFVSAPAALGRALTGKEPADHFGDLLVDAGARRLSCAAKGRVFPLFQQDLLGGIGADGEGIECLRVGDQAVPGMGWSWPNLRTKGKDQHPRTGCIAFPLECRQIFRRNGYGRSNPVVPPHLCQPCRIDNIQRYILRGKPGAIGANRLWPGTGAAIVRGIEFGPRQRQGRRSAKRKADNGNPCRIDICRPMRICQHQIQRAADVVGAAPDLVNRSLRRFRARGVDLDGQKPVRGQQGRKPGARIRRRSQTAMRQQDQWKRPARN